jgi:hypothetical protein
VNARRAAAELAFLAAASLCAYGGVAFAVAAVADGQSVSFAAVAAAVALPYGLGRLSRDMPGDDGARLWTVGLSLALFALLLQIEIAGPGRLLSLPPLRHLLLDPAGALEGHAGNLTEVLLLAAVWLWGLQRGLHERTIEELIADAGAGLVMVVVVAAFAEAAGAPALRWLPAPYMFTAFLALALANLEPAGGGASRPLGPAYAMWTAAALAGIAGLALLASLLELPSIEGAGHALAVLAGAVVAGVALVLSPVIIAVGWTAELLLGWLPDGGELPDPPETPPLDDFEPDKNDPPGWALVLGYVLRAGLVALLIAGVLALFWAALRRRRRRRADEPDLRESVEPVAGPPLGDLRALLAGALGRLPGVSRQGPRDAIGRLYVGVLRESAARGLERPQSATALEFAPALSAHWRSPVVVEVSRAYSEARYGRIEPSREEIEALRAAWEEVRRAAPAT